MFSLYTHDLPNIVNSSCLMYLYADDHQMLVKCNHQSPDSAVHDLSANLARVDVFSKDHGLVVNSCKSAALCVESPKLRSQTMMYIECDIKLNDDIISFSEKAKNLGVLIDSRINFESVGLVMLACIVCTETNFYCPAVNTLVLSFVDYCCTVYFHFLINSLKHKLQILQRSCFLRE